MLRPGPTLEARKKLVPLSLVAIVALLAALPASAYWTFTTYSGTTSAMCTGEANYSGGDASCEVDTAWGQWITTHEFNGYCAAAIDCGDVVKTCLATEQWGFKPAVCYAVASDGGDYKAVCKSDNGSWALRCE